MHGLHKLPGLSINCVIVWMAIAADGSQGMLLSIKGEMERRGGGGLKGMRDEEWGGKLNLIIFLFPMALQTDALASEHVEKKKEENRGRQWLLHKVPHNKDECCKTASKKEHKHVDISGSHTPVTACGPGEKLIDSSVSGRSSPSVLRRSQDDYWLANWLIDIRLTPRQQHHHSSYEHHHQPSPFGTAICKILHAAWI